MTTAFVLSGGGSLGAVQVGMLQALSRVDLQADMVIGASAGALNGAFFAFDPTPAGVERLADLWRSLRRKDIFPLSLLAGLKALLLGRDHIVEADKLRSIIRRTLGPCQIEQARIALHVVTTEVLGGAEIVLSSGNVEAALLASTAIPVVFPPVRIGAHQLIDGGVSSNTPIACAIRMGAERILVLPAGMSCALREAPRNMAALALHVMTLLSMRQLDRDVQRYATQVQITIVPPLCPLAVSAFDFSQSAALIERSSSATADWLAAGGLDTRGPLHVPLAHYHAAHAAA